MPTVRPSYGSGFGRGIVCIKLDISDSVKKPCAIVVPKGDSRAARTGSVWMNWSSSVVRAKESIRSCVTVSQSLATLSFPFNSVSRVKARSAVDGMTATPVNLNERNWEGEAPAEPLACCHGSAGASDGLSEQPVQIG